MQVRRKRRKALLEARREADAAWQSLEEENFQLAAKQMARAVGIARHSVAIRTDQARILVRLGKLKEAERAARHALVLDPDFADAHVALAEVLSGLGLSIEAYRSQERAVALQPGIVLYRELLASYEQALPADYGALPDGLAAGPRSDGQRF